MELMLGTAQFGLAYGIAGAVAPVPPSQIVRILDCAAHAGIRLIDTAQAYGSIESQLLDLLPRSTDWRITTKISVPVTATDPRAVHDHVRASVQRARQNCAEHLDAVMLHDVAILDTASAQSIWRLFSDACGKARAGVSLYSAAPLDELCVRFPGLGQAQIPGNALDQRAIECSARRWPDTVHLRSAFLQGLLLMPAEAARSKLPGAAAAIGRWHDWCATRQLSPLGAALSIIKGFVNVHACVVGVDGVEQLEEIVDAWNSVSAIAAPELATDDLDVIDPRRWSVRP